MQTLHQYMMETKAVEYILAVAFLFLFIVFWRFLHSESKGREPTRCRRSR